MDRQLDRFVKIATLLGVAASVYAVWESVRAKRAAESSLERKRKQTQLLQAAMAVGDTEAIETVLRAMGPEGEILRTLLQIASPEPKTPELGAAFDVIYPR